MWSERYRTGLRRPRRVESFMVVDALPRAVLWARRGHEMGTNEGEKGCFRLTVCNPFPLLERVFEPLTWARNLLCGA